MAIGNVYLITFGSVNARYSPHFLMWSKIVISNLSLFR